MGLTWFSAKLGGGGLKDDFETCFIAGTVYNLLFRCLSTLFLYLDTFSGVKSLGLSHA